MVSEQSALQLRAVFLICLLAGAECARVHTRASFEATTRTDATREELGEELSVLGSIMSQGKGHDVCRLKDLKSPHGAVDRYKDKAEAALQLADKIKNKNSTLKDLWELGGRESKFASCQKLVQVSDGEATPQLQELTAVMKQGNYSIRSVEYKGLSAVVEVMKKRGLLKTKGNCGFDLLRLDLDAALTSKSQSDPMDVIRAQLFGPECKNSEEYLRSASRSEKKIIKRVIDFLSSAVQGKDLQQLQKEAEEETLQEISKSRGADLDSVLDSDSDATSLLELELEPTSIAIIITVVLLIIVGICAIAGDAP